MLLQMAQLPSFLQVKIILLCVHIIFCFPVTHLWAFVIVVQSLSRVQLSVTPWTSAPQASLSFTISWSLFKLMSIESVMPSNHLTLCYPLFLLSLIFPRIRVFCNEPGLHIRWPEYWTFSFSISPSNEYSGLICFRIDWFDFLAIQGTLKESSPAPQFESISSLALSLLYDPTLTSIHDYLKNHSFDYTDLCQQSDVSAFFSDYIKYYFF